MQQSTAADMVAALRRLGFRMTRQRRMLIDCMVASDSPFTVQSMCQMVPRVDEASVYRTFTLLEENGLIRRIHGYENHQYELARGHHHHIICTACGYLEHLACTDSFRTTTSSQFRTIDHHDVTLFGVCRTCSA